MDVIDSPGVRGLDRKRYSGGGELKGIVHTSAPNTAPLDIDRNDLYDHYGHDSVARVSMIRESSAVAARQNLGDLLNQVQYRSDAVLITKDGKPVAALVDVALFERIRRLRNEFTRLTDSLGKTYEGVTPAVAQREIEEAVSAARKARAKRIQTPKGVKSVQTPKGVKKR